MSHSYLQNQLWYLVIGYRIRVYNESHVDARIESDVCQDRHGCCVQ